MYAITDQYILNVSHSFFKISKKSTVEITAMFIRPYQYSKQER